MREEIERERERQRERERERGVRSERENARGNAREREGSEERERDGSGAHYARTDDSRLLQFFQSAPLSLRHVRLWPASEGFFLIKKLSLQRKGGGVGRGLLAKL
jgi:hypothetical protein